MLRTAHKADMSKSIETPIDIDLFGGIDIYIFKLIVTGKSKPKTWLLFY